MSNAHSSLGKSVGVGASAGVMGAVAMAAYAMIASDSQGKGFFTPMYHIASLLISKDSMMTSMQQAMMSHSAFYFTLGAALLGAIIHMMTGAMYGVVLALVIARVRLPAMGVVVIGAIYGAIAFVVSAYIGLPLAAAIFNSGDQITHMPTMVGTGTFLVEHVVFGLVTAMILVGTAALARSRRPRVTATATATAK